MARPGASGGSKSPRTQLLLGGIITIGILLIYWQFIYSPLKEEHQRQEQTHHRLEKDNKDLKDQARVQSLMIKCKPELDALNRQNELMLPADAEPVAFLKVLTNLAGTAGLEQGPTKEMHEAEVTAAPEPPAAAAAAAARSKASQAGGAEDKHCWESIPGLKAAGQNKATFIRVPFEIELRGTFYQLVRYFWMLYQNAQTGRIITIENLALTNPASGPDGMLVTAKFVAVGFREVAPDSGPPGAGGRGAAAGGRGAAAGGKGPPRGHAPTAAGAGAPSVPGTSTGSGGGAGPATGGGGGKAPAGKTPAGASPAPGRTTPATPPAKKPAAAAPRAP